MFTIDICIGSNENIQNVKCFNHLLNILFVKSTPPPSLSPPVISVRTSVVRISISVSVMFLKWINIQRRIRVFRFISWWCFIPSLCKMNYYGIKFRKNIYTVNLPVTFFDCRITDEQHVTKITKNSNNSSVVLDIFANSLTLLTYTRYSRNVHRQSKIYTRLIFLSNILYMIIL